MTRPVSRPDRRSFGRSVRIDDAAVAEIGPDVEAGHVDEVPLEPAADVVGEGPRVFGGRHPEGPIDEHASERVAHRLEASPHAQHRGVVCGKPPLSQDELARPPIVEGQGGTKRAVKQQRARPGVPIVGGDHPAGTELEPQRNLAGRFRGGRFRPRRGRRSGRGGSAHPQRAGDDDRAASAEGGQSGHARILPEGGSGPQTLAGRGGRFTSASVRGTKVVPGSRGPPASHRAPRRH